MSDDLEAMRPNYSASRHPLKFDGTINIPTIIMLVSMLLGGVASLVGVYNSISDRLQIGDANLGQRISNNDGEIRLLKSQAADAKLDRERDRQEMQNNLHDINGKLDQLLWDRGNRKQRPGGEP